MVASPRAREERGKERQEWSRARRLQSEVHSFLQLSQGTLLSHRQKSDVVILRHEGTTPADAHGGGARLPPRYSVLSSGAEWVVAETEHNAFESVVLLLFHVAKHGGFLGSVDLKREIYSTWTAALSTDGAAPPPEPRSAVAYHAPLAILHPWSEGLDALPLAEVTASLNK